MNGNNDLTEIFKAKIKGIPRSCKPLSGWVKCDLIKFKAKPKHAAWAKWERIPFSLMDVDPSLKGRVLNWGDKMQDHIPL